MIHKQTNRLHQALWCACVHVCTQKEQSCRSSGVESNTRRTHAHTLTPPQRHIQRKPEKATAVVRTRAQHGHASAMLHLGVPTVSLRVLSLEFLFPVLGITSSSGQEGIPTVPGFQQRHKASRKQAESCCYSSLERRPHSPTGGVS